MQCQLQDATCTCRRTPFDPWRRRGRAWL